MEWNEVIKERNEQCFVAFLPFTAGQLAAESKHRYRRTEERWRTRRRGGGSGKENEQSLMTVKEPVGLLEAPLAAGGGRGGW